MKTQRVREIALVGLAMAAALWSLAGEAGALKPLQLSVGSTAQSGDFELAGTYTDVAAAINDLAADSDVRIALTVAGMPDIDLANTEVSTDDATQTVTFEAVASSLGANSPAAATSLALVADWDDAVDVTPVVAVILIGVPDTTLSTLDAGWTGGDVSLTDVRLVLSDGPSTIAADDISTAAAAALGLDAGEEIELIEGASLSADHELASPAGDLEGILDEVGASGAAARGPLTGDLSALFAGTEPTDSVFAVDVVARGLPTPSWMDSRSVSVRHELADALTRTDTVVYEGVTFSGSDVLGDTTNSLTLAASSLTPPFGLHALLGTLTNVELTLFEDQGAIGGSLAFTLDIGDGTRVEMSLETDGDRVAGTLAIDDQVGLGEFLDWLKARPGFDGLSTGLTADELDRVQLLTGEFTLVTSSSGTTVTLFADSSVALAGDPIAFQTLLSINKPTDADAQVLLSLRSPSGASLGDILPVPEGAIADLTLPRFTILAALPTAFSAAPADLGPRAVAYLEDVLGSPLDDPLDIGPSVLLRAEADVASLGDDIPAALGWDATGTIVLEGDVGIDLAALFADPSAPAPDPSAPVLTNLSLSASIPNGAGPDWLPAYMSWPQGGDWTLEIAYDNVDKAFSFTAGLAGAEITLPGDDSAVSLDLSASFSKSTEGIEIALSGAIGDWVSPYGVEWLTINSASLDVTISKPAADTNTTPPTPRPAVVSVGFAGALDINGKQLEVNVDLSSGGGATEASIRIALLNTVTVSDIADALDADLGDFADSVGSLGFGPGELVVTLGDGWQVEAVVSLQWDPYGENDPITAKVLLNVRKPAPINNVAQPLKVTFGLQPDQALSLDSFLPESIDVPFDIPLVDPATGSTVGFVYSNGPFQVDDLDEGLTKDWFTPLFIDGEAQKVTTGIGMYGAIPIPDAVKPLLSELGVSDQVQLKGKLPIGAPAGAGGLSLSLGMRLDPAALPTAVDGAGLALELSIGTEGLSMSLIGDITFAIEQGLRDPIAAATLADVGVVQLAPVLADATCPNGGKVKLVDTNYYCHDLLTVEISAQIEASAAGASLMLNGNLYAGDPSSLGDATTVWHPMGIDWLGFRQMQLSLGLEVDPTGTKVTFGVAANIDVAGKNLSGALSLSFQPIPSLPFVLIEFNGMRAAAPNGLSFGDIVDVANALTGGNGSLTDSGLPDIGLRNLSFSLSPLGVPELCIAQGLRLQADLYINPTDTNNAATPTCDPNGTVAVKPGPSTSCAARRSEGCFAGILLDISKDGIIGQGSVAPFDIGPIHWKGGEIDVALSATEQRVYVEGEGEISVGGAVLVYGRIKLDFDDLNLTYYGELQTLNGALTVLVDGKGSVDVFNEDAPAGINLHVLVSTSSAKIGDPSLGKALTDSLIADLQKLNTLVDGLENVLKAWEAAGGGATQIITDLPAILAGAGITTPAWLASISNTIKEIDQADIGNVVNNIFDAVLNGVDLRVPAVCFGALGCTPPFGIIIPGICTSIFPDAVVNGKCTIPGIARTYITPLFRSAINATVAGLQSFDATQLDTAMKAVFDGIGKVVRLDCAEFFVDLGPAASNTFALSVQGAIFGEPVGFGINISPSDFTGLSGRVDQMLADMFGNIVNDQDTPACQGYNSKLFGIGEADPEAPVLPTLDLSTEWVNEGSSATAQVALSGGLTGTRNLTLNWGDGTIVTVPSVGKTPVTVTHLYADDNPTGTTADSMTVTVTDPQTGKTAADSIAVNNIVPVVGATFASAVDEGTQVSVDVTVTDPGNDSQTVLVTWGDGSSTSVPMEAGVKNGTLITVTHTYDDDNPTFTPHDIVAVSVTVLDDDLGFASSDALVTVRNVAPTVTASADVTLDEFGTATVSASFTDPSLGDTHGYQINWGDGNVTALVQPPASRAFTETHQYGDDGIFTITVTVADDDSGTGVDTVIATVNNINPTADIAEPIDGRTWILADGTDTDTVIDVRTMLATRNVASTISARSIDPGSDDLTFNWAWGDGTSTVTTYRSNRARLDPKPSTEVNPRDITDAPVKTWANACLYRVITTVTDDDGGSAVDATWVVVTGTPTKQQGVGSWTASLEGKGSAKLSAAQTACYLRAIDHLSVTFGAAADARPLVSAAEAIAILNPSGGPADQLGLLDRAILAGWLELMNGGVTWNQQVDTNGDRVPDAQFGQMLRNAETLRADPNATAQQRSEQRRLLSKAVNL